MSVSSLLRQHWAALRALLVFTLILGGAYPLLVWLVAQVPWLSDEADGSIGYVGGKAVGSSLVGQSFTDARGNALPRYLQGRPSAAGAGYDPMASGASNLGPESIVDVPVGGGEPSQTKPSLLTQVCSRSLTIGRREGVSGARPYCTGDGVGAVLSVIGPRDNRGEVAQPVRVISVNEPCFTSKEPFLESYRGVRVECAAGAEDQSAGQLVPIRGAAPDQPAVPADAVTASGSGLDPDISPAYGQLQVNRIAAARGISPDRVRDVITSNTHGRVLGFLGESTVNVLAVNRALDRLGG